MSISKFDFGSFSATPDAEVFTVAKNYTNPTSEMQTRKELSFPLSELKNYINTKIFDEDEVNAVINTDLIPDATTSDKGLMSAADKTKLNGIESGAEVNIIEDIADANGTTLVSAITSKKAKLKPATNSQNGYMTSGDHTQMSSDHTKLSGITGVNVYYGRCTSAYGSAEVKVVTTTTGDFTFEEGKILVVKFDTHNSYVGTISLNVDGSGAKEVRMQTLTDTIRDGMLVVFACNTLNYDAVYMRTVIDSAMSDSSTNPVRNNVIKAYVDNAISGVSGGSNVWTATYSGGSVGASTTLTTNEGGFALSPWNKVIVKFTNAYGCKIYDTAKLNIDGAGAKSVLTMDGKQFAAGESWQYSGVPDANKIAQNTTVTFTYDGTNFIADRYNPGTRTEYGLTINNNGFGYAVIYPNEIDPLDPTWMVKLTSASGVDMVLPDFGMHIPYVDIKMFTYTETDGAFEYTPFTGFTYKINEPSIMPTDTGDVDLVITFGSVPATNVVICVHGNFTNFDASYV